MAESFFSTLKNELVHHQTYHTWDEASREIFAFIEGFYNRQQLHQSLYIADTSNHCVRQVRTSGIISTFAGQCGNAGFGGDGGPVSRPPVR